MESREFANRRSLDGLGEGVLGRRYRALTIGILLSVGIVAFESLGVATVLPVIAVDLDGVGAYGWGVSALMLANIVGTVLAGRTADQRGPTMPMLSGMLAFAAGCLVAGAAWSWPVFLAGRVLQGAGVGAVMAMAYTMIALAYPENLRARMFALLSSAWTVPSLVGPFASGALADSIGWRWVFVTILPLIAVAFALTMPGLRRVAHVATAARRPAEQTRPRRWRDSPLVNSIQLTFGTALLLQALLLPHLVMLVVLGLIGVLLAVPALRGVTPSGTLTARPGLGAGVVIRGLLCGAYFGSEVFLSYGLQELRGQTSTAAGLSLSAGALTWVVGSFLQARRDETLQANRALSVTIGSALLAAGTFTIAATILLPFVPVWLSVAGWACGGLGMGIAFNASTTATLDQTPARRQGEVSGSLQLAQTLATGLIAGIGTAVLAYPNHIGVHSAVGAIFALTSALAVLSVVLAPRIRAR